MAFPRPTTTPTPGLILSFIEPSSSPSLPSASSLSKNAVPFHYTSSPPPVKSRQEEKLELMPLLFTSHVLGTKMSAVYKTAADADADVDGDDTGKQEEEKKEEGKGKEGKMVMLSWIEDVERVNKMQVLKFWGDQKDVEVKDVRVFREVQVFEKGRKNDDSAPNTIMLALMQPQPGGEKELDDWYREEHNEQMSEQKGWRRTWRGRLVEEQNGGDGKSHRDGSSADGKDGSHSGGGSKDESGSKDGSKDESKGETEEGGKGSKEKQNLSFLAIHEFDAENDMGDTVKALEPVTDWTKKVMAQAVGIDAAIYRRL